MMTASVLLLTGLGLSGCSVAGDQSATTHGAAVSNPTAGTASSPSSTKRSRTSATTSLKSFGSVRPAEVQPHAKTRVWRVVSQASLPGPCDSDLLVVSGKEVLRGGGTSWAVLNSGETCSIQMGTLVLKKPGASRSVANLRVGLAGFAKALVVPAGGAVSFSAYTEGPCVSTAAEPRRHGSQNLQVKDKSAGRSLGDVTVPAAACKEQAIQFLASPITEAVRASTAPAGIEAHLPAASIRHFGDKVAATLFVTNTTAKPFSTDRCPTVTATLATAHVQAATRTTLTCGNKGFRLPAHSSLAIDILLDVAVSTQDYLAADVGGYLSLGVGDDASRAREDA